MATWQRIAERNEEELRKHKDLLKDLLRCGDFYYSAIELNRHVTNPIDGEEFEKRIKELVND